MLDPQEVFDRANVDHEHVKATVEDIFDEQPAEGDEPAEDDEGG